MRFGKDMVFGDMVFRDMVFGNSFTAKPLSPIQIMISKSHILGHISNISKHVKSPNMLFHSPMGPYSHMGDMPYMSYIRYRGVCQLSSYPAANGGGGVNILDTKYSIYKHYIGDMGILGYKGLKDINV